MEWEWKKTLKKIEREDLVDAVLASRDHVDSGLETQLLENIVVAEADSAGDGDAAMQAMDAAITAAIGRGVGLVGEDAARATEHCATHSFQDIEDGA